MAGCRYSWCSRSSVAASSRSGPAGQRRDEQGGPARVRGRVACGTTAGSSPRGLGRQPRCGYEATAATHSAGPTRSPARPRIDRASVQAMVEPAEQRGRDVVGVPFELGRPARARRSSVEPARRPASALRRREAGRRSRPPTSRARARAGSGSCTQPEPGHRLRPAPRARPASTARPGASRRAAPRRRPRPLTCTVTPGRRRAVTIRSSYNVERQAEASKPGPRFALVAGTRDRSPSTAASARPLADPLAGRSEVRVQAERSAAPPRPASATGDASVRPRRRSRQRPLRVLQAVAGDRAARRSSRPAAGPRASACSSPATPAADAGSTNTPSRRPARGVRRGSARR